jgi:hypothetical protein
MSVRAGETLFTATGGAKRAADNKNKPGGSASVKQHGKGQIIPQNA